MKGLVIVAWLTFVVNQEISRRRAMTNVVVEGRASMLAHAVPIAFGASVLILSSLLTARVLAGGGMWPWVGTALVLLGLAFSTWARIELGASSRVGLKQDHVLISSGPYQFAQHPMYVGAAVGGRWNRIRCRECCGFSRRSDRLPRARHQGANREKLAGADQGSRRDRPVLSVSNMLGTSGIL